MNAKSNSSNQGSGFAKAILFGEHAVVYGYPAIACGLGTGAVAKICEAEQSVFSFSGVDEDLVVKLESPSSISNGFRALFEVLGISTSLKIDIELSIPTGAGLGSSAAIGAACSRALVSYFDLDPVLIEKGVEAFEIVFHSAPSGVDQAAALHGGVFKFSKKQGIEKIKCPALNLVIANVGDRAPTTKIVKRFASQREIYENVFRVTMEDMGRVVEKAIIALANEDLEYVGRLLSHNQRLLKDVGVSSEAIDRACMIAQSNGALGSKLTGAGNGGCIIALVEDENTQVEKSLQQAGFWTQRHTIKASGL